MDLLTPLLILAGTVVLSWLGARVRAWRAKAQAARLELGQAVAVKARLWGEASPYPPRARAGRLDLAGGSAIWRHRSGRSVPLALVLQRVALVDSGRAAGQVFIRGSDDHGVTAEVVVDGQRALLVRDALAAGRTVLPPGNDQRRSRAGGWPGVVIALGLAFGFALSYLMSAGHDVEARVVARDSAGCSVEWKEAGRSERSDVDCGDEKPGDRIVVRVLAPPLQGAAVDVGVTVWIIAIVSGGAIAVAIVGIGWRIMADRRWRLDDRVPTTPSPRLAIPKVDGTHLNYATVATAAKARAEVEGWVDADGRVNKRWRVSLWKRLTSSGSFWMASTCLCLAFVVFRSAFAFKGLVMAAAAIGILAAVRRRRSTAAPTGSDQVRVQYVLVVDHVGMPAMLLFGVARDAEPLGLLPLATPLLAAIPVTGPAIAGGSFRSGELLSLTVDGETLRPSRLLPPDPSVILGLANADVLSLATT